MYVTACGHAPAKKVVAEPTVNVPAFVADSAYNYVKEQVDFGPRIPNSAAQLACAAYLSATLRRFGAQVIEQKTNVQAFDGTSLRCINIIGSFNLKATTRILLFSHWDSRPWADNDPMLANRDKPVMGANDGASGVGVLLEMARQISKQMPLVGVDIIFFDVEDYGAPSDANIPNSEDTWCLGTQYWAKNPHVAGYKAKYGILLDMVGGINAVFPREQVSMEYAKDVVDKVWATGQNLGFSQYFLDQPGGIITDDHVVVNKIIGIPSIDIIHYDGAGFVSTWHTVNDTMDNIDINTLNAVGTTLMHVIYNEK